MYKILHVTLKKVGLKSNTYKHFLYICTSIGSLGHAAHQRLKGNRVKIPNSSRCCESQWALRHLKSLDKARVANSGKAS